MANRHGEDAHWLRPPRDGTESHREPPLDPSEWLETNSAGGTACRRGRGPARLLQPRGWQLLQTLGSQLPDGSGLERLPWRSENAGSGGRTPIRGPGAGTRRPPGSRGPGRLVHLPGQRATRAQAHSAAPSQRPGCPAAVGPRGHLAPRSLERLSPLPEDCLWEQVSLLTKNHTDDSQNGIPPAGQPPKCGTRA